MEPQEEGIVESVVREQKTIARERKKFCKKTEKWSLKILPDMTLPGLRRLANLCGYEYS